MFRFSRPLPARRDTSAWKDAVLAGGLRLGAVASGSVVLLVGALLFRESLPALGAVGSGFLLDRSWHPAPVSGNGTFGLLPMAAGTLAVTVGAIALAAPLGLMSAILCRDYVPPWLGILYKRVIELMAGVPSVVYGLWGMTVLAPMILAWRAPGVSLLA
ncbi:MAG: phosphate ABC transporter permease subunit PstC, partial [Gammaproteobacteria bacterium]|nr:phosphate ABC transporter permease subunit PstC [Gammaproteobacteria bacterium]